MATKDKRQRGLRESILAVLTEEEIMQSSVFEMGKKRGEELGEQRGEERGELKVVVRGYELQLRRPLTDTERRVVADRRKTLGMDRLLDVQRELSPDALAAWLADASAT